MKQCSSEEEEELNKSVKKFKESSGEKAFTQPHKVVSYRDSLLGEIPGAYIKAFQFAETRKEEEDSDNELEGLTKGMADVKPSKETKARIMAHGPKH